MYIVANKLSKQFEFIMKTDYEFDIRNIFLSDYAVSFT